LTAWIKWETFSFFRVSRGWLILMSRNWKRRK